MKIKDGSMPLGSEDQTLAEQLNLESGSELSIDYQGAHYWSDNLRRILSRALELKINLENEGKNIPRWAAMLDENRIEKYIRLGEIRNQENDEHFQAITEGRLIPNKRSLLTSIDYWYRSLGPTDLAENMAVNLKIIIEVLDSLPTDSERDLLIGNIYQDLSNITKDTNEKYNFLMKAAKIYESNVLKNSRNKLGRAAFLHRTDCYNQLLNIFLDEGKLDLNSFHKEYEKILIKLITFLKNESSNIPFGEFFEIFNLVMYRYKFWVDKEAESNMVRMGLAREDSAIYPWKIEYGADLAWSSDIIISSSKNPEIQKRIQLKSEEIEYGLERSREYLGTEVEVIINRSDPKRIKDLLLGALDNMNLDIKISQDHSFSKYHKLDKEIIKKAFGIASGLRQ